MISYYIYMKSIKCNVPFGREVSERQNHGCQLRGERDKKYLKMFMEFLNIHKYIQDLIVIQKSFGRIRVIFRCHLVLIKIHVEYKVTLEKKSI